jgi:serine-type D-Ala-D-Ala endopeptidase (penicillin-binding protein 7)
MVKWLLPIAAAIAIFPANGAGAYGLRSWDEYQWQHSYNVDEVRSIASITKLFTAVTVLNSEVNLTELVKVQGHTSSKFTTGMMVSRLELMRAMLISSDNRAAESLAHAHPGGMSKFIRDVQWEIGNMGLTNTKIIEPTGLSPMNISTVEDLSNFLFYMRNNILIRSIAAERTHQTQVVKGKKKITVNLRNTNPAVFTYDNILISKTGTTNAAGKCVAMLIERNGALFAVVVLGQKNGHRRNLVVEELLK